VQSCAQLISPVRAERNLAVDSWVDDNGIVWNGFLTSDLYFPRVLCCSRLARALKDIIERLQEKVPVAALKLGGNGSVLITKKETVRTYAYRVKCVDTTGPGDAFTAALIYGLNRGFPLEKMGLLANWFAAQTVMQLGSRKFPPRSGIQKLLDGL